MKFSWKIALCAAGLATGCAATRPTALVDCASDAAQARGSRDGAAGHKADLSFLSSCSDDTRPAALISYREAFSQARPKRKSAQPESTDGLEDSTLVPGEALPASAAKLLGPAAREPSAISWVCEVEANSRVFTGVGITRDEALSSARTTCGSHFQASTCTKTDCKQNL